MVGEAITIKQNDLKSKPELIFVYNANSGKWNAYMDTMHKIVSPKTYACSLCAITYGNFGIKEDWADFKKSIPLPMRFLHKDEWEEEFDNKESLPAIFLKEGEKLSTFLPAEKMNQISLEQLKYFISNKIEELEI